MGMVFVALYKYINNAVDKTIGTGHTSSTDCYTDYRIKLLMMLFITSWCQPEQTHLGRYVPMPLE